MKKKVPTTQRHNVVAIPDAIFPVAASHPEKNLLLALYAFEVN